MYVVWLFLSISGISAMQQDEYFKFMTLSNTEGCEICYSSECLTLDKARCEYYREVNDISRKYENYESEANDQEVDGMLMDYIDRDTMNSYGECIPILSQYTNCHKDNTCTGCETCNCDVSGNWICNDIQRCHSHPNMIIDHRTLVGVIENLKEYMDSKERTKRSTIEQRYKNNRINYEELLKWINRVKIFEENGVNSTTDVTKESYNTNENNKAKVVTTNQYEAKDNSDLVLFDDLLNSLTEYKKHTNHSKAIFLDNKEPVSFDLMKQVFNDESEKLNDINSENVNINNNSIRNLNLSDATIRSKPIIHLKKRDVKSETNITNINSTINYNNNINRIEKLQKNVLFSLNNIVNEKQKELKKLTDLKENLIVYLKSYENISIPNNTESVSKLYEYPHIHLYQVEVIKSEDYRKQFPNIFEQYLKKLKKDIYEVVQDVASMHRLTNSSLPHDLKILIRAMKYYVYNENKKNKVTKDKNTVNLRKQNNINNGNQYLNGIINILEYLDKNLPADDVTTLLSKGARKISRRIIKSLYRDDLASSKLFESKYDVLNDLRAIEKKWRNFSFDNLIVPISERLYSLKLLHVLLSKDMFKLTRAVYIIEFAQSRRVDTIDEIKGDKIILKMKNNFQRLNDTINQIINFSPIHKQQNITSLKIENKDNKSMSFFQRIKKLLKKSKSEIQNLFHKNISKSDLVKEIAKKKMNEITKKKISDYEEIMRRWQNNFNMITIRKKRSAGEIRKFFDRIKNIVPNYFRRKRKLGKKKRIIPKNHRKGHSKKQNRISSTQTIKLPTKTKY